MPPSDRKTDRPPRPSTKRFVRSGADSRKLDEAQDRIIRELFKSIKSVVSTTLLNGLDRFAEGAPEIVRGALLQMGLDMYLEGKKHGRTEAAILFHVYQSLLDAKYAAQIRDPRAEPARPFVTLAELHETVVAQGFETSLQELSEVVVEMKIPLAPNPDDE